MGRREVSESMPWDDAHGYVAYTNAALELAAEDGDGEVAALLADVAPLLERWMVLDRLRLERAVSLGRTQAQVRRRISQAHAELRELHNRALGSVNLDRSDPFFKRLFPSTLTELKRLGVDGLISTMRTLSVKLAEAETPEALREVHGDSLQGEIRRCEVAVLAREQATAARSNAGLQVASWKSEVNRTLLGVEGRLKDLAARRRLETEWVDSFFPAAETPKRKRPVSNGVAGVPA